MPTTDRIVPLVPRQRLVGLSFGGLTSARRGQGSDVAGSRPYQPGDDVDAIDWNASARLSSARGSDEFVVREKFAEEAPHVVVVADRRPEMDAFPPHLPWVSKPLAMRHATEIVFDSALAIRGVAGYLDFGDGGEPFWKPPRAQRDPIDLDERKRYDAPTDISNGGTYNPTTRKITWSPIDLDTGKPSPDYLKLFAPIDRTSTAGKPVM